MPITFDVFDSESRAPKGRIHIFWLNWEDLPRLYDPALSDHVVKITDKHPILHDIDIPRIPTFDLDPPITELSGGTGFGASVKEDRVTTFHDLRALMYAYWDACVDDVDGRPTNLKKKKEELNEEEKILKRTLVTRIKGISQLKKIKEERESVESRLKMFEKLLVLASNSFRIMWPHWRLLKRDSLIHK